MDYKRANRAYLYMILSTLGLVEVIKLWYLNGGGLNILTNNFLSEMVTLIPAVAAVMYSGEKLTVLAPMHKLKVTSVFLIFVYVIALFPLVTLVNSISMFFVENTVNEISDEVLEMPMWIMIIAIGIVGPFIEEFVFRGILLQSYQRTGRIIGSIILSSVLFGMMHMNFNQFAYGTVMGVMLALLVEATGSILASFLAHAFFNTIEVVIMYATSDILEDAVDMAESYIGGFGEMISVFEVLFLAVEALVFTAIAVFVVRKIASIENRSEFFNNIFKTKKQGYKLITIPLVIAMLISLTYMIILSRY